jgi:hypothetical protein
MVASRETWKVDWTSLKVDFYSHSGKERLKTKLGTRVSIGRSCSVLLVQKPVMVIVKMLGKRSFGIKFGVAHNCRMRMPLSWDHAY